ncbi:hypothetical protein B0T17DRAFT_651661 [Bombardia bombarda]|uniref:Uncharacterized protein n=1 Tax=Bombardia bombarda TaxID=252184 RepID=A0AA39XPG1_9PEZI|nr:hypothetical protein B0T17DRAFT_651661 [Bombardia bombarda]
MSSKRQQQQQQSGEAPTGEVHDNSYVSRPGHKHEPMQVVSDNERLNSGANPAAANSDAQLQRDENDAIDKSNIIDERLRGAEPSHGYKEPGDEEGLPANDGTSRISTR